MANFSETLNQNFKNQYDMVVIGCSAGGIETLSFLLHELPKDFSVPIAIVQHISPDSTRSLAEHFSKVCLRPVFEVEDKQPIEAGSIYFAPANYHLMISKQKIFNLSVDAAISFSRPSIDVLFQTATDAYLDRLIGIVLTGTNQDGSEGLKEIREHGGLAIVQNPATAKYGFMPETALKIADPQFVFDLNEISLFLNRL